MNAIEVIHICPKNDPAVTNYADSLSKAFGGRVRSRVADGAQQLREMCKDRCPDIIHQHGSVGYDLPRGTHVRRILTPHGASFAAYAPFYTVIARSRMEARRIDCQRMEILRNPIITKTVMFDEIAALHLHIYRKVMDTDVLQLMSDETRQTLHLLLKAGICGDRRWLGSTTMPTAPDWRQLSIYAFYEHVEDVVRRGAEVLGIDMPAVEVSMKTAYLPRDYQRPNAMEEPLIPTILESVANGNLNLRLLTDLDRALKDENLDEEELLKTIEEQKRRPLFESLLKVLEEQLLTDEGFLPCPPVDNRETQRLRNLLSNHLKI